MTNFPIHTLEFAPERSKPALQQLQSGFGMIPNIRRGNGDLLIDSLVGLFGNVHGGSFTKAQIQAVLLTNAVTSASTGPVAFHTALALKNGIDERTFGPSARVVCRKTKSLPPCRTWQER
jgi:hypothetical protein